VFKLYTFSHILLGGIQRETCENVIKPESRKTENKQACMTFFLRPNVKTLKIQRAGSCKILYPPSHALHPPYFISILPLAYAPFSYVKTALDAIRLYRKVQKSDGGV
jgi:hypothetical protein